MDPGWVVDNLFLDSLLFLRVLPPAIRSIADIGSGAGFPGIPVKIVRPDIEVVLVESRQRRVSFLSAVVRELGLSGVRVLGGRAEHLASDLEGAFDAVLARCAGGGASLAGIAARLVAPGGLVVFSGSPSPSGPVLGDLVEVPGVAGRTRHFVVHRSPGPM